MVSLHGQTATGLPLRSFSQSVRDHLKLATGTLYELTALMTTEIQSRRRLLTLVYAA